MLSLMVNIYLVILTIFWKADKRERMHQQCWLRHSNNPIWQKWRECQWDKERVFTLQSIFSIILSCSLGLFPWPVLSAYPQTPFPFSGVSPSAWLGPRVRCGGCSWACWSSPRSFLLPPSPFECHSPLLKDNPQTGLWATKESIHKLCV